jgi:hypothetical protein
MQIASELDRALLNVMADHLAANHVDLGDETQVILALSGHFPPRLIDTLLDLIVEAARVLRANHTIMPEDDWLTEVLRRASTEQEAAEQEF